MNPSSDHAHRLLQVYFSGRATPDEIEALQDWLREDASHVDRFVDLALLDGLLIEEQKNEDAAAVLLALRDAEEQAEPDYSAFESLVFEPEPSDPSERSLTYTELWSAGSYIVSKAIRTRAVRFGAIAAVLTVFAGLVIYLSFALSGDTTPTDDLADNAAAATQPEPATPLAPRLDRPVATITATHNAVWASPQTESASALGSLTPGSLLRAGDRLTLTQGFAEMTTRRGAVAILEAPATIELTDSDNAIRLHTGKIVGLCHTESSKGFVVRTDHADITDLGTEFGVEVSKDNLTTTVFVGEVAVKTPNAPSRVVRRNQTARLTVNDKQSDFVIEDRWADGFTRRAPRPALVTDVKLSVEGFKARVLPSGVYEDAKLFTDRTHEINGADETGIPAFLLGGDLIQMPADAREELTPGVGDRLRVELQLAEPTQLYVLMPPATPIQDWLSRDYEYLPGIIVGQDSTQRPTEALAIGPGKSIDRSFHIWKRRAPAVGRVTAAGTIDGTMYALIATPYTGPANDLAQP
jgi:hypothetical protein